MNNVDNQANQSIPGVRVAPPNEKPVDATTDDVGAAVSKSSVVGVEAVVSSPTVVNTAMPAQTVDVNVVTEATLNQTVVSQNNSTILETPIVVPAAEEMPAGNEKKKKAKKPKNKLARFYFFVIILLIGGIVCLWYYHQQQLLLLDAKCTPVSTSGEIKELSLNSTIVVDLYGKVKTNIREDIANVELNDQMKIYLAYRQIANGDMYESHCNKFNSQGMEPFKCEGQNFTPMTFKAETLQIELKKLFGEDTNIANQNVQLGRSCVGGFQYVAERNEYVQGRCETNAATLFSVDKKLVKATSKESIIELYEDVKYYGNEGYELSEKLISGRYKYTFKLDMNYNYVYVSKMRVE